MSKIDYQKLREIAEKTKIAGEAPVMPFDQRINALNDFMKHFSPDIALALLDERERNLQYIKSRDQENEDIALTVGKLRVELEAAENNLIDSECHVAELEEALRDKQALLEASEKRIAELEAEPVSQTYKSQHTQFEQVADLYEMQFDDGRTCAFHTDAQKAAQWLQACDGNRVQEYVKLERLQNALSGNSPVTPDGWISCSDRMPSEEDVLVYCSDTKEQMVGFHKGKGLFQFFYMNGVEGVCEPSHWMPLPEPPL
ncbi:ead/Ea22-like family protein [Escherichia coli]|uniref:ead/Ea22-like family protein n=1 Tax=Escherichia coli TaxID=562 RepID=UPI001874AE51|nr:ead/Ea22-like family protein [Escherichia coli]MCN3195145.1 ead/Ea22-like family protein [Escherichia coli]MCV2192872.1 ead/Ea22-like family protein [Escherichia coli]